MKTKHSFPPQKLAVIGDPVKHSLSPAMQNAALKRAGFNYTYKKIHVTPQSLENFCLKARQGKNKLAGFNITLPHKENILPYLDWISPLAKLVGAANTVVNHQDKLLGFNTDGLGYVESLKEETDFKFSATHVTLIGAGGAACGVAAALAQHGVSQLNIANRTLSKAKDLVKRLSPHFPKTRFTPLPLNREKFHQALRQSQLITNTTSLSLKPESFALNFPDFPWQKIAKKTIISDLVYTPKMTAFLKAAKNHRLPIHPGLGMLLHQGALAFQLWTGQYPDVDLMREVLEKKLRKKS